jgi:hypothetical protein
MVRSIRMMLVAAVALAWPALAMAQASHDGALKRDIRCMLIISQMQVPPEQQASIQITQQYLFGRMDVEAGDTDWTDRVAAEARSMEGKDIAAETAACGAYISEKGKALVERGERLQAIGKARQR